MTWREHLLCDLEAVRIVDVAITIGAMLFGRRIAPDAVEWRGRFWNLASQEEEARRTAALRKRAGQMGEMGD